MESDQTPLLRYVIYTAIGAKLLDVAHETFSAAGKFWRFPGCPIHTASRAYYLGDLPGRLQGCITLEFGGQ